MKSVIRNVIAAMAVAAAIGSFGAGEASAHTASSNAVTMAPAGVARPLDDPAPSCENNNNTYPCWHYVTWYWTYANCDNAGNGMVNDGTGRYDDHLCTLTSNGIGVGLWLHQVRS